MKTWSITLHRVAILLFLLQTSTAAASAEPADCTAIHTGPCTKQAGNRKVTLEIDPKPVRHMAELTFKVTITPGEGLPSTLLLDLSMPGMVMGRNQLAIKQNTYGTWEGKGIIVKCMSGRTRWRVTLLSPELANPSFTFNVRD